MAITFSRDLVGIKNVLKLLWSYITFLIFDLRHQQEGWEETRCYRSSLLTTAERDKSNWIRLLEVSIAINEPIGLELVSVLEGSLLMTDAPDVGNHVNTWNKSHMQLRKHNWGRKGDEQQTIVVMLGYVKNYCTIFLWLARLLGVYKNE